MATWDEVRAAAADLPETTVHTDAQGRLSWRVRDKLLAWERPLRPADLAALGDAAPTGPILGIRTRGEEGKRALIAQDPDVFFTTPHFRGYPAVLARLERLDVPRLERLLLEAFLVQAPKRLARRLLDERGVPDA